MQTLANLPIISQLVCDAILSMGEAEAGTVAQKEKDLLSYANLSKTWCSVARSSVFKRVYVEQLEPSDEGEDARTDQGMNS